MGGEIDGRDQVAAASPAL